MPETTVQFRAARQKGKNMEQKNYIQCQLQKDNVQHVCWIEEQFAIKGKILEVNENNNWQSGWEVTSIGAKVDAEFLVRVLHMPYKVVK